MTPFDKSLLKDKIQILDMAMEEMAWPQSDLKLLSWYFNRLGLNGFLRVWQEQSYENEKRPPRSKYHAFRARLSDALGHTTPKPTTPNRPSVPFREFRG